jgi:hypothetical protein
VRYSSPLAKDLFSHAYPPERKVKTMDHTLREQFDDLAGQAKWNADRQIDVLLEFLEDFDLHERFLTYADQLARPGDESDQASLFPLHVLGDSR